MSDYSEKWYSQYANRYAEVSHQFLQSIYIDSSHPKLTSDLDLLEHLKALVTGRYGLDAGCGAGARDVYNLWLDGYDMIGIDAVKENVNVAIKLHPEIEDRLSVTDLTKRLPFTDSSFDFVLCNAVIQHIDPNIVKKVVLPELCRVLKSGGILQLMFKKGNGVLTVTDQDYNCDRSFQLYDEKEILKHLQDLCMKLVECEKEDQLGGVMFFTDVKPTLHCVFYAKKQ